ncbi:MAG: stage V sporulation protein SpoVM [Clostridiales bacterium]|nr:stage V sporulation protein SpoVM [Clostridiales bacterium]
MQFNIMKIVVVKSPRLLASLLRKFFHIDKKKR